MTHFLGLDTRRLQSKRRNAIKERKAHYSSSASLAVTGVYYHASPSTALQEMLMGQALTCLNELIHRLNFLCGLLQQFSVVAKCLSFFVINKVLKFANYILQKANSGLFLK